jgi:hypothetical protein
MKIEKGHYSFVPKLAEPKSETGELLLHGHSGGGRPISAATDSEVG